MVAVSNMTILQANSAATLAAAVAAQVALGAPTATMVYSSFATAGDAYQIGVNQYPIVASGATGLQTNVAASAAAQASALVATINANATDVTAAIGATNATVLITAKVPFLSTFQFGPAGAISNVTMNGAPATGVILIAGSPTAAQTLVVGADTYTAVASGAVNKQFNITTPYQMAVDLANQINKNSVSASAVASILGNGSTSGVVLVTAKASGTTPILTNGMTNVTVTGNGNLTSAQSAPNTTTNWQPVGGPDIVWDNNGLGKQIWTQAMQVAN